MVTAGNGTGGSAPQRLGGGQGCHRRAAQLGGAGPGVTTGGAPPIQGGLCGFDAVLIRQGAPDALGGGVHGFFDHALAVAASWWADRD